MKTNTKQEATRSQPEINPDQNQTSANETAIAMPPAEGRSIELEEIETKDDLTGILEELVDESSAIYRRTLNEDGQEGQFDSLRRLVEDWESELGVPSTLRTGRSIDGYGISNISDTIEEVGVMDYWIQQKSDYELDSNPNPLNNSPVWKRPFLKFFSEYRKKNLNKLVRSQGDKLLELDDLLDKTLEKGNVVESQLYEKHLDMINDARNAEDELKIIESFVENLKTVQQNSQSLEEQVGEDLDVKFYLTKLRRNGGRIRRFYQECLDTENWLRETEDSYKLIEDVIDGYMGLIKSVSNRIKNSTQLAQHLNDVADMIGNGEKISDELFAAMDSFFNGLTAGMYELDTGVDKMTGYLNELENQNLPRYVTSHLGGPASDIKRTQEKINESKYLSRLAEIGNQRISD